MKNISMHRDTCLRDVYSELKDEERRSGRRSRGEGMKECGMRKGGWSE